MTLKQADRLIRVLNRIGADRQFTCYVNRWTWYTDSLVLVLHNLSRNDAGRWHGIDISNSSPARAIAHFRGFIQTCPARVS
jgi:hypothetical protein